MVPVDDCGILTMKGKIVRSSYISEVPTSDGTRKVHRFKYKFKVSTY